MLNKSYEIGFPQAINPRG